MEEEQKRVTIKYKNGLIFCDGIYSVLKKTGLPKHRIGIWKFYYPNGELEDLREYDKIGELINRKNYSENGTLIFSEVIIDNITNQVYYYDNGKIRTESITKVVTESNGDDEYEITYETLKEYFQNGQLYSQAYYENDDIQGTKNFWDTTGLLVLSVEYNKGLMVLNK